MTPPAPTRPPDPGPHPGMGFAEFVVLIAALMALSALGIDSMLPALPTIAAALGAAADNERQWIVTAYLLGFGVAQLFYGTLTDRYGRKPVLAAGLLLFLAFSLLAALSSSFEMLLAARALQGVGAASTRVLPVSIVRDCYAGRQMARVMSLSGLVFMAVPILAPTFGQLILLVAPWRWEFGMLAVAGVAVTGWAMLRLPETLAPRDRAPIAFGPVLRAFRITLTNRLGLGYTLASTFIFGGLFGFINSAQQVFSDAFHAPGLFTSVFALVAGFIALASLTNARLVERLGTRAISHAALLAFIALSLLHASIALAGRETLLTFTLLQSASMFAFGLVGGNFGAMAMDPLGHVAGTASSVQGFISMVGGALAGLFIGQHFDGTMVPITLGYAICGVGALACVLYAEGGRLFRARHAAEGSA